MCGIVILITKDCVALLSNLFELCVVRRFKSTTQKFCDIIITRVEFTRRVSELQYSSQRVPRQVERKLTPSLKPFAPTPSTYCGGVSYRFYGVKNLGDFSQRCCLSCCRATDGSMFPCTLYPSGSPCFHCILDTIPKVFK